MIVMSGQRHRHNLILAFLFVVGGLSVFPRFEAVAGVENRQLNILFAIFFCSQGHKLTLEFLLGIVAHSIRFGAEGFTVSPSEFLA